MRKTIAFIMSLLMGATVVSAQASKDKITPVGKWKFEAPYAPEGYNSGTIEIGLAENKYSSTISFTGSDFKIQGEKTKVEKDSATFIVYVEGNEVTVSLKAESETKMTGKAVYSEGEIPVSLTKEVIAK